MSHNSLGNYYQVIFSMAHQYHYSIEELENIYPFERDIYLTLLNEHINKQRMDALYGGG
jgi:hypothetical protein